MGAYYHSSMVADALSLTLCTVYYQYYVHFIKAHIVSAVAFKIRVAFLRADILSEKLFLGEINYTKLQN